MYILTRDNVIIDYCAAGYLCMGSTVVCEDKQTMHEDATIVDIGDTALPADIDVSTYEYILGEFIRVHNATKEYVDSRVIIYNISIATTDWSASAPYTSTKSIIGILATDTPLVDVLLTGTSATDLSILENWSYVSRITTDNDSITLVCYEDCPTVELPIQLKVVR